MNKVFDCFMYNDEEEVLSTRLQLLSEVVDRFVIVFSRFTFAGTKQRTSFPREIVTSLGLDGKVRVIELEKLDGDTSIAKERFSRDALGRGLDDADSSDLVIVSDLDEIPRPSVVTELAQSLGHDRHIVLGLDFFNFKFNYQQLHGLEAVWPGPVACRRGSFKTGNGLRDSRFVLMNDPACHRDFAGWHFSFLTATGDVVPKLQNSMHQEESVQSRRSIKVAELIARREGFMDHRHPGSVWAIVGLTSFGCPPLEQLVKQLPRFVMDDPPDDPSFVNQRVRHAVRKICLNERDKILLQATWQELASCLAGRAGHKAALMLKRAGSLVSSARL